MSFPVTEVVQLTPTIVGANSYAPSLASLNATTDDDVVWLYVTCGPATSNTGTLSISGSGWQTVVEANSLNNPKVGLYYCVVASGTVAQPTITLSGGAVAGWLGSAWVERDCELTPDPVESYVIEDSTSNLTSRSSGTHTPGVNNCRIVYLSSGRNSGSTPYQRMLENAVVPESTQAIFETTNNIGICQIVASAVQDSAASTVQTVYNSATMRCNIITLAILNKSGGKRAISSSTGLSRVSWCGNFGDVHDGTLTPVRSSRGNPTSRTINGIAVNTTAATFTADSGSGYWGSFDAYATNVSGGWQGTMFTYSADLADMTDKFFSIEYLIFVTNSFAAEGLIVVFEDNGGTNWLAFQLSQSYGMVANQVYTSIIDVFGSTPYDSGGSLTATTVRKVSVLGHRFSNLTSRSFLFRNLQLLSKTTLTGGNSVTPLTANYLRKALQGFGCLSLVGGEAPAITVKSDLQFGDGTKPTYLDTTGTLITFPTAYNNSIQRFWNVDANTVDITIKAASTDTMKLNACTISANQEQNFTYDAASHTSAAYDTTGASIIGMAPTLLSGETFPSATFSGCDTVNFKGAIATGVTVTDTTSTNAAASWDANPSAAITDCTIDGTGAAYAIELGTAVTAITLTDCTLTAGSLTPFDKIHVLKTTDTVTITISGTTSLAAGEVTSAGATVDIVAPVYYRGLNFTGLVNGSKVKVFTAGTQTVLYGTDSVTGNTFAFDDSTNGATTVDYTIQKAGYVPIRVTGAALNGSTVQATGRPDTAIAQVVDRAYSASSGLTYGTTAVVTVGTNPTTNPGTKTFTLSAASTPQNWYSFWIEQWIDKGDSGEALANVTFPLQPNGPNSFSLLNGWEFSDGATSIANFTRDGLRYVSAAGATTASWAAILTSGALNKQVRYQQSDGGTTSNGTMLNNEMDQLIQIYGDATHGNFNRTGYLVLKVQAEGYDQAEANVITLYGTLEDQLYVVGLTPTANTVATGNPAIALTLTREVVNDVTSGLTYGIKIVSAASGEDIMRQLRYEFADGGEYPAASGYDAFEWHDLVQQNGSEFKTVRGNVYGTAATDQGVVVYSSGTTLHPDFNLFTGNSGTYTPPVTADISITSMPNDAVGTTRLQIRNTTAEAASAWAANTVYATGAIVKRVAGLGTENTLGLYFRAITGGTSGGVEPTWVTTTPGVSTTTDNTVTWLCCAVLYYDADPGATSLTGTYIDGEEFLAGETVDIRFAEMNGASTFKTYDTTVITTSAGFSALVSEEAEPVFATYAIDGSTQDGIFSPNYTSSRVVMDANIDFSGKGAFAYYCYVLTTSEGMARFWGGVTAVDAGNMRINTSILNLYFDESAGFVKQTDDVRIYRDDGTRPAIDPTTGGHGIEINWRTPVSVVSTGGSALTPSESAYLLSLPTASAIIATAVDGTTTMAESFRLANSVLGGKVSGAGTGTETFRDLTDTKDRVVATVDTDGNRTAITRDLT